MEFTLDAAQARVLGVLLEKESTTPDAYPLSLNAITVAANQKSSRDPVMQLSDADAQDAIDALVGHTLVTEQASGRVLRYAHRISSRLFGKYEFDERERALVCVLLLRGPQTPGELRARTARLHPFADTAEAEAVLRGLARREDGPFVVELAREPGRRESRFAHLMCGEVSETVAVVSSTPAPREDSSLRAEIDDLRARVERLELLLGESLGE